MRKTMLLVLSLSILGGTAQASDVVADLEIRRVRLTDKGIMRVRADYFCPAGFAVPEPGFTQAYVFQYSEEHGNPQKAKPFDVTCDATHHELIVRFARPWGGLEWAAGALTNARMDFVALPEGDIYLEARAGDSETVRV
jgi:hypothetical protein